MYFVSDQVDGQSNLLHDLLPLANLAWAVASNDCGSTSDEFALFGKYMPVTFYFTSDQGAHGMPTSPDYFETHNHAILRNIQKIIKMHALFYVNDVVN